MVDTQCGIDYTNTYTCTWCAKPPFEKGSFRDYSYEGHPVISDETGWMNTSRDAYRLSRHVPRNGYFIRSADKTKTINTFPKPSPRHSAFPTFSPKYPAELVVGFGEEDRKIRIVCRGVQFESFSPDSEHYTAAILKKPGALKKPKWRILIDGHEVGDWFDDIQALQFSEDSKRIRFAGRNGSQWTRVVRLVSEFVSETEVSSDNPVDAIGKIAV